MPKIKDLLPLHQPSLQDDSQPVNNTSPEEIQETNNETPPFDSTRDFEAAYRKAQLNNLLDSSGDSDIAKYLSSKEFSQLDVTVQKAVKENLETVRNNPQAVENFIELAKSGGFRSAGKELQSAMLDSLAKRPEDKIYREALQEAVGRDNFKKLAPESQARVIEDLDKFADTTSYKGDAATKLSDEDKRFILERIRKTSVYSGQNPTNDVVRNTLDNIVSGNIQLKLYEKENTVSGDGVVSTDFGYNKSGTKDIYINKKANDADYREFIDTLAHETNHALNGNTKIKYVTDALLSEYRAHIAGQQAAGGKVDKQALKALLNNLVLAEPLLDDKTEKPENLYSEIRHFYRINNDFKAFIDQLVMDIDKGIIVDGSDLRTRLINAGCNSDYIINTSNINNR